MVTQTEPVAAGNESPRMAECSCQTGNTFCSWRGQLFRDTRTWTQFLWDALDSKQTKFIVPADANPAYAEPGLFVLCAYRDKTLLWRNLWMLESLTLKGEPVDLLSEILYVRQVKKVAFAVSNDGLLLAQGGGPGVVGYWRNHNGLTEVAKDCGVLDQVREFMGMWRSRRMTWPWLRTTLICRA